MRILVAHNYYLEPGGEDTAFRAESALLRSRGHDVVEHIERNERIASMPRLTVAANTVWSRQSYASITRMIEQSRPDIVHFHNTFPLISPSAYYACRRRAVPVVQTLYNPRLICPAGSLYRAGNLCTECVGRIPLPGVLHGCYRGSRSQTLVVASMLTAHRWLRTWARVIGVYLVATQFYRQLFIRGGLPGQKLVVKPNFVSPDPGYDSERPPGSYALFVGRLDPEKGVRTLLSAWRSLEIPLIIRGDGQLETEATQFIKTHRLRNVQIIGRVPYEELRKLMSGARFLVWPSEGYYETFGFVASECYAAGVPVVASRIGVMEEIVHDGETGLHFSAGSPEDLAARCLWLWQHPEESRRMGARARLEYENKYTAERNYAMLMSIYARLIEGGPN
jgi:glycosyltransferase involved in cell wall biosynthesis